MEASTSSLPFSFSTPVREHYTPPDADYTARNELQLSLLTDRQRQLVRSLVDRLHLDYPQDIRDLSQVVKFLEAKNWDLQKSEDLFKRKFEWVTSFKPHHITESQVEQKLKTGKVFLHGRDRHGRPILVIRACNAFPMDGSDYDRDITWKSFVYMAELAWVNLPPPPYNQVIIISDRKHHGRRNMDTKALKMVLQLGDYYPELLHSMLVLNANWIFSVFVNLAKAVVDSTTLNKLIFVNDLKEMPQYVEQAQLLPDLGGLPDTEATRSMVWLPSIIAESLVRGHKRLNPSNHTNVEDWIDMYSETC